MSDETEVTKETPNEPTAIQTPEKTLDVESNSSTVTSVIYDVESETTNGNENSSDETPVTATEDVPVIDPVKVDMGPQLNVTMSASPLRVDPKRPLDARYGKLSISRINSKEYWDARGQMRKDRLPPDTPDRVNWLRTITESARNFLADDAFEASVKREESQWQQSVDVGAETIRADRPKFTDNGTTRLVGEEARLRIRAAISAGSRVRIPLWYSGIWVTIKAPTERELAELEERIAQRKIDLGWSSNGLVFSSTAVYLNDMLIDFVLDHVSESSYQMETQNDLRKIILQPDFMQLVWGMLCAIYPDGYVYEQPCMLDPLKCSHVETARLNFGKMQFVDNRAFSDWQRQHMRKRNTASMPKIDVERYQSEHKHNKFSTVKLNDTLSVEFKVPTLDEYADSGSRWIDGIVASVEDSFSKDLNEDERNAIINSQSNMTLIRQYSHWIRLVALTQEERYIEDRETLEDVVADLTSDEDVFRSFFDGIKKYIDSIMVVVHGIPKYPCPNCQGEPPEEILKHPMVYPIDLAETFFTLVGQRIRRMLTRQR